MSIPREILTIPDKPPPLIRKKREARKVPFDLKNTKRKLFDDLEDLENWVKTPEIEAKEMNSLKKELYEIISETTGQKSQYTPCRMCGTFLMKQRGMNIIAPSTWQKCLHSSVSKRHINI